MSYFPQPGPYVIEVEPDSKYFWCACGRSASQPFCDGSHKSSQEKPVQFSADRRRFVYLCGCKKTANPPYCDGSHRDLKQEADE